MSPPLITVFTPTYNRAYKLPTLYESLKRQTCKDFEWLVIDDGSTDNTEMLVKEWSARNNDFIIRYYKKMNGGKPRAINDAVHLADTPYLFIIDSDDYLTDDIVAFLIEKSRLIEGKNDLVGIGILRGYSLSNPYTHVHFKEHVIASNLERSLYNLNVDCNELYKIDILKQFPFQVWEEENFSPEEIVLNEMALNGYKLIWFDKVGVIAEYLEDGMTRGAWNLLKRNPMGYAMLYNHKLKHSKGIYNKIYNNIQLIALSILGHHPEYILKSNTPVICLLCIPLGIALSIRRALQFRR